MSVVSSMINIKTGALCQKQQKGCLSFRNPAWQMALILLTTYALLLVYISGVVPNTSDFVNYSWLPTFGINYFFYHNTLINPLGVCE